MLRAHVPSTGGSVFLASFLAFLCAAPPGRALAQEIEPVAGTDEIVISFDVVNGTDLLEFVGVVQRELGYQFHYKDSELKPATPGGGSPKIFTLGAKKIRKADLFKYFQAVLREQDFVCVRIGSLEEGEDKDAGFWSIRKVGPAGGKPTQLKSLARIVSREELEELQGNPGILVTTAVSLEYVSARDASTVLTTYFADQFVESVRNIENSNTLLLTGYASTLAAIMRLIEVIDKKPENMELKWVRRELQFAVADELQPILKDLITASRGGAPGQRQPTAPVGPFVEPEPQIIADPRTNSLLVTAVPDTLETIKHWIDELDVEVDPRGDTHVYRLRNVRAKELEEQLSAVIQGQQQGQRPQGGAPQAGGAEQQASVVAHEPTNSVIITASRTKYAELLEIVKQLDVRPAQVLIEAAMIEISNTLGETLGVELQTVDADERNPFGVTSFGFSTLLDQDGDGFYDTRIPNIGQGFTGGIFDPDSFEFPIILSALANEQNANVLSLPSILTNDNEEAVIQSTDEVPYTTNTVNSSTGEAATSGFGGYAEAGIKMLISPTISAGNFVRLHLNLEISTFSGTGSPPPKIKRNVDTQVTIPDGHTMVIGGLIIDDVTRREDKIPILGDIPLLGFFFRSSNDQTRKINLYVFITPHIISDDFASLDDLTYRHRREVESLDGKVELLNRFFPEDNADMREKSAAIDELFDMPSYVSPPGGETEGSGGAAAAPTGGAP
ncbi:MAG: secretin N-terminal domain-containing protein [Planctomycetota bacterium]